MKRPPAPTTFERGAPVNEYAGRAGAEWLEPAWVQRRKAWDQAGEDLMHLVALQPAWEAGQILKRWAK